MANEVMNDFKKGSSNFRLVGKMVITPNTFKMESKSGSGYISNKMYVGVNCGKGNVVYSQMFGGYYNDSTKLYLHGKVEDENSNRYNMDDYSKQFEIAWADRFNADVLVQCGAACFTSIALEKDVNGKNHVQKFLSPYDAIGYIKDVVDKMSNEAKDSLVVEVRGKIDYNYYEGKVNYQKTIESIALSNAKEEDYTASFTQTVYADKDCFGKPDMERHALPLNVKVAEYVGKYKNVEIKETVPMEVEMELDANAKLAPWLANNIKKSNGYAKMTIIGNFVESGSTEAFDKSSLPADVQKYIEDGVLSEDDVIRTVASGNQRKQILMIKSIKTSIDENKTASPSFEASAYTSAEIDNLYSKFIQKVKEIESNDAPKKEAPVETPNIDTNDIPFDIVDNTDDNIDSMSWLKDFND
jgi:hypothetical protein